MNISQKEIIATVETEINLLKAERYINFQLTDKATEASNSAADSHRALNWLYARRRGEPRRLLGIKIHYYGIWQRSLVGVLQNSDGHSMSATLLLSKALADATDLVRECPDSPEFKELLRKVKEWQSQ